MFEAKVEENWEKSKKKTIFDIKQTVQYITGIQHYTVCTQSIISHIGAHIESLGITCSTFIHVSTKVFLFFYLFGFVCSTFIMPSRVLSLIWYVTAMYSIHCIVMEFFSLLHVFSLLNIIAYGIPLCLDLAW